MGTKYELLEKIEVQARAFNIRCHITGIGICVDREQTTEVRDKEGRVVQGKKGNNAVRDFVEKSGVPVYAVAGIREIVAFLYREKIPVLFRGEKRPIDEETKVMFDSYLEVYGVA